MAVSAVLILSLGIGVSMVLLSMLLDWMSNLETGVDRVL